MTETDDGIQSRGFRFPFLENSEHSSIKPERTTFRRTKLVDKAQPSARRDRITRLIY
jgi:hypothetical protein